MVSRSLSTTRSEIFLRIGWSVIILALASVSEIAFAAPAVPTTKIQDMTLDLPSGWSVLQDALDEGTALFIFENNGVALSMFVKAGNGPDPRQFLVNGSTVVSEPTRVSFNGHAWTVMQTKKSPRQGSSIPAQSVFGFFGKYEGNAYYGYARGGTEDAARLAAIDFLSNLH